MSVKAYRSSDRRNELVSVIAAQGSLQQQQRILKHSSVLAWLLVIFKRILPNKISQYDWFVLPILQPQPPQSRLVHGQPEIFIKMHQKAKDSQLFLSPSS